jgi:2-oxo-4-hydroxy-4-carboxy--5-ureidoimidazoline (OHCU) decarboxylase
MTTARQRYKQEYTKLVEERRCLAFKGMGFISAVVQMNKNDITGGTFQRMQSLAQEFDKLTEEIAHIESLLDLIDYDDSNDDSDWQ